MNNLNELVFEAARAQLKQEAQAGADARDYALLAGVMSDIVYRITGVEVLFNKQLDAPQLTAFQGGN